MKALQEASVMPVVGQHVFVYGTLRKGQGANYILKGRSEFVSDCVIHANIYDLGSFPGVKLDDTQNLVYGEV